MQRQAKVHLRVARVLVQAGLTASFIFLSVTGYAQSATGTPPVPQAQPGGRATFKVYDNIFYRGKPDTRRAGLIAADVVYEAKIWRKGCTQAEEESLPARSHFDALMKTYKSAGPLILDVETLKLNSAAHERVLATLADWAHEDFPGRVVGYYGTHTFDNLSDANRAYGMELAKHVDAMFPSLYTYSDDQNAWATKAQKFIEDARAIAPGKPVYTYIWPQYHEGTKLAGQYLSSTYWAFELETLKKLQVDGVVIWSSSSRSWDDSTGWWEATTSFISSLR